MRFQAEHVVHGAQPRYRHTWHALNEIYRREGLRFGLYRGVEPTVVRAAFLTSAQLATYDHAKHALIEHGWVTEGPAAHFMYVNGLYVCVVRVSVSVDLMSWLLVCVCSYPDVLGFISASILASLAACTASNPVRFAVLDCVVRFFNQLPLSPLCVCVLVSSLM